MKNLQPIEQVHARLALLAAEPTRIEQELARTSTPSTEQETFTREQLLRWAFTDGLTALPNRRALAVAARRIHPDQRTWVAIDLNGFKAAQDKPGRGHAWGDGALRSFAAHLSTVVRKGAGFLVARTGGDEFVAVCDHPKAAERVAHHARTWLHDEVSASAGIGSTRREADRELYQAKATRKLGYLQTWAELEESRGTLTAHAS